MRLWTPGFDERVFETARGRNGADNLSFESPGGGKCRGGGGCWGLGRMRMGIVGKFIGRRFGIRNWSRDTYRRLIKREFDGFLLDVRDRFDPPLPALWLHTQ